MSKYPIVTISLINYNGRKFVFEAIESAVNQNYPNLEIILIDNNSTDGTKEDIEKMIPKWETKRKEIVDQYFSFKKEGLRGFENKIPSSGEEGHGVVEKKNCIKYIKNSENAGFGKPHNMAMRMAKGEFILLLNYDAILEPDYIENVLKPFADEKVGAVQGKLLRYDFEKKSLYRSKEDPNLNIIDTTGLKMLKNRRIVCRGQGDADRGQFEEEKEVFGADGAVPVYRKSALEDIKMPIMRNDKSVAKLSSDALHVTRDTLHEYEYFDENFFMYKEDVDLAWRLRLYGWKAIYTPQAVAVHGRGSGDSTAKNYIEIIKERRKINNFAKFLSFKHQRLMQIKNDLPSLLFTKHFSRFIVKEVGAWIYMAVFERFTFRILKDLRKDIPLFWKKRKIVMANKKVSAKEMEKWFE